jgi:hypothetical protein
VPREMVGNWLYGVALQTAIRVKAMNTKRRGREIQVAIMPESEVTNQKGRDNGTDMLDQELSRLPEKYRVVIVLCDLEGRTRKQVAQQLGWPEGSVSGRLARGRAMLAKRLAKRGLVLSAEAVAVLLSQNAASALLPPSLVSATVTAASILATGQTAVISAKIVAITKGVLTSMLLTKLKTVAAVSVVVGVLGVWLGARFVAGQTVGASQEKFEKKSGGEANALNLDDKKNNEIDDLKLPSKEVEKLLRESGQRHEKEVEKLARALADSAALSQPAAQKQRENAAKWEYTVAHFLTGGEPDNTIKQMNALAAEGWEYVGLVATTGNNNGILRGAVAFKRLKN